MREPQYDYAVIGGDMRQVYLTEELAGHQNKVCYYHLMSVPNLSGSNSLSGYNGISSRNSLFGQNSLSNHDSLSCFEASSLEEACIGSSCIVCPIPFSRNGLDISQNIQADNMALDSFLSFLHSGQYLFAGCIPQEFQAKAEKKGIRVCDLMKENSLAVYNTIATAEGALCEAITRSPQNIHHSQCAVLGYGKCGYTLTQYLKGMFCHVHVYSKDKKECAQAGLVAEDVGTLQDFEKNAGEFDFVFNTVPALIVNSQVLARMKPSVLIVDIASNPGGVDYMEAEKLGIHAVLCPGLPGKYAPSSSAKAVKTTIESFLSQERK